MRIAVGVVSVLVSALVLVGATGCTPAAPPVLPAPVPSVTPLFASEEEVLAAAEEAFAAFLATMDQIRAEGGANPERIQQVATLEIYEHEREGLQRMADSGQFTSGATSFDTMTIQQFDATIAGADMILAYVCEDFSGVEIMDGSGAQTGSPDRQVRWPLVVGFQYSEYRILVSSIEDWDGQNFCD